MLPHGTACEPAHVAAAAPAVTREPATTDKSDNTGDVTLTADPTTRFYGYRLTHGQEQQVGQNLGFAN